VAKGKQTSPDKTAAVMAALLAGQGVCEVAAQFQIPESTVRGIKSKIPTEKFAEVRAKKENEFGELLAEYLRETIITLREQTKFFREKKWLERQSASETAVLHGVQADKALRLLEAIERANAEETTET
jgi:hypothetical protein